MAIQHIGEWFAWLSLDFVFGVVEFDMVAVWFRLLWLAIAIASPQFFGCGLLGFLWVVAPDATTDLACGFMGFAFLCHGRSYCLRLVLGVAGVGGRV